MATPTRSTTADGSSAGDGGVDGRSGYCAITRTFRSLRAPVPLPPATNSLSFRHSHSLSYLSRSLREPPASMLPPARSSRFRRSCPRCARSRWRCSRRASGSAPTTSPSSSRRLGSISRCSSMRCSRWAPSCCLPTRRSPPVMVARLVALSGAFAVTSSVVKLPAGIPTVLLDSDSFRSFLQSDEEEDQAPATVTVRQFDMAAI
ncbi:unnamed protein product [Urochloa humidicola]